VDIWDEKGRYIGVYVLSRSRSAQASTRSSAIPSLPGAALEASCRLVGSVWVESILGFLAWLLRRRGLVPGRSSVEWWEERGTQGIAVGWPLVRVASFPAVVRALSIMANLFGKGGRRVR